MGIKCISSHTAEILLINPSPPEFWAEETDRDLNVGVGKSVMKLRKSVMKLPKCRQSG